MVHCHWQCTIRAWSLWSDFSLREGGEPTRRRGRPRTRSPPKPPAAIPIHNSIYGSSDGCPNRARTTLDLDPHDDRAEPDRPPPGRRLDQSEHPRELPPRPPPVRHLARHVVPRTTRPSPPIWPSSTTPAGARASPPSPSPPPGFAPDYPTTRTRPEKRPAASSQVSAAPPPIAAEAGPTPLPPTTFRPSLPRATGREHPGVASRPRPSPPDAADWTP